MTTTVNSRRRSITLAAAAREFVRHPSPWVVLTMLVAAVLARVALGRWSAADAITPAAMIVAFPFFEWTIHVLVLHWKPRRLLGFVVDPLLARDHRRHHADPRDVPLVFIPWKTFFWIVPLTLAVGLLAYPVRTGLTFIAFTALLGLGYEWTHYLIHTDYVPRSRFYRAIHRNHRLHHFKNEHYWFTVTSSGTADRLLGTYPDPANTATSRTAKALHAG